MGLKSFAPLICYYISSLHPNRNGNRTGQEWGRTGQEFNKVGQGNI